MLNIVLKGFVPLLLTAFAFFSCTSSKKTTAAVSRDELKGTWQLDNITYEGLPQDQKVKLTLLGEGPEVCLKGSTWVLPNNGNGSYTINSNDAGCSAGQEVLYGLIGWRTINPYFNIKNCLVV